MKQLMLFACLLMTIFASAQYGTNSERKDRKMSQRKPGNSTEFKLNAGANRKDLSVGEIINAGANRKDLSVEEIINDSIKIIKSNIDSIKNSLSLSIMKKRDSIMDLFALIDDLTEYRKQHKKIEKIIERNNSIRDKGFRFFSKYADESEYFYEDDTDVSRLFKNNRLTVSPSLGIMSFTSEAVHDYFGPFRLGISFSVTPVKKTDSTSSDSAKKAANQTKTTAQLQNGGGDVSLNVHYPIWGNRAGNDNVALKLSAYYNVGFSLPVFDSPVSEYILTHDIGADFFASINGFRNKIHFYGLVKAGYVFGNKDFKQAITKDKPENPKEFFMGQGSIGLDFNDGYRIQYDFYFGHSFIGRNFPATVTFVLRPKS
jgi:hypothetical protein